MYGFKNIIGNNTTISLIKKSLRKKFPKFTILYGNHGTGKSTVATSIAMAINCKSGGEEPCLECSNCKMIIDAVSSGRNLTSFFQKVNVPMLKDAEFKDLAKEIFTLDNTNAVYVLEEAHAFSDKRSMNILMEFIDGMSDDTYIIMTTTEYSKILPALRSRAVSFSFSKLNDLESRLLIDKISFDKHVQLDSKLVELILRGAKGVPRDVIKLIDFVISNDVSEDEFTDYLNVISDSDLANLFINLTMDNIMISMSDLDRLSSKDKMSFIISLREFITNVIFVLEGDIDGVFSEDVYSLVNDIFTTDIVYKIINIIEGLTPYSDITLAFIKIRQLMRNKSIKHITTDQSLDVSRQINASRVISLTERKCSDDILTKTDLMAYMDSFGEV